MFTTPETRAALRQEQLVASGLVPARELDPPPHGLALPSERSVWRLMAGVSANPVAVVTDLPHGEQRAAAYGAWLAISRESGVVSPDGSFLISVTTNGPDLGWAHVRLTPATNVPNEAIQEFVALSEDGRRYSAISSEERAYWIMAGAAGQPPR